MNGLYTYKQPTYVSGMRTYVEHSMRVTVVAERANKYQVKYHGQHASGAAIGSLHWVRKDKVKLDGWPHSYTPVDASGVPLTEAQAVEVKKEIGLKWLPYKDNDYDT